MYHCHTTYSHNLALLKQSLVNTTDQTSIESLQAHYQHAIHSQRSYKRQTLSILTAIFQVTQVSQCLLKQRMMEDDGGGGDNWTTGAISRVKLQSDHHHQQTNIQFLLQAGCPSCHPTNSVKAPNRKISHSMDLLTPSSPGGLPTLSLTTNSSWLPRGGLSSLSSAL